MKYLSKMLFAAVAVWLTLPMVAGKPKFQNFKVSTYIRAQDVARMDDEKFLKSTWEVVNSQVDLDKIYLETHRDAFTVPEKTMLKVKRFFLSKGLEVGGGITYTRSEPTDFETYSYARPDERQVVKEVAEYTAKLFDDFILDDFFFIDLKNDDEIAAKGAKSWTEYRLRLMADAGRELVVNPAKAVNPKVKVIVKYPNWYDHFHGLGFNLEEEPVYFDGIWTGTETRDPGSAQHLQNYLSYNVVRYFDNIAPGKNGGGWVDAGGIHMSMDRYAEQLHLTMLSKTPEIILWNYMQLCEVKITPQQRAKWQEAASSFNYDAMVAPYTRNGKTVTPTTLARYADVTLHQTDKLIGQLGRPIGLASYKPYHSSGEDFLQNYLGMIGLPMDMHPQFLADRQQILLTEQAAKDPQVVEKIKAQLKKGGDVIITTGLLKAIRSKIADICELYCGDLKAIVNDFGYSGKSEREFIIPQVKYFTNDAWEVVSAGRPLNGGVSGYPILLRDTYSKGTLFVLTIPDDYGNLYDFPAGALNIIRRAMSKDVGAYIEGPSKVSLFPYDNKTMVVENFNDEAVSIRVVVCAKVAAMRNLLTGEKLSPAQLPKMLPMWGRNRFFGYPDGASVFDVRIPAHSYVGLGY
ncbi:hypothetical protein [Prevotella sp. P6B4]|uniref:hypothetical protein n=1 Tax=Prevotella sp. P6B4 TaxID=1410614 RepID=UPI000B029C84|nr:hypothetical protein [Prevotella sp. P6B4]